MRIILSFLLMLSVVQLYAQKLEQVTFKQINGEVIASYQLSGDDDTPFNVSLFYSNDGANWIQVEKSHGAVGDSIFPGSDLKISLWIDHLGELKEGNVHFKLVAKYDKVNMEPKGQLTDDKGNVYDWVLVESTRWMVQNLKTELAGASGDDPVAGLLYNAKTALTACPDKWHLATDEDWQELEISFGMDTELAKEFGLRKPLDLNKFSEQGIEIPTRPYNIAGYKDENITAYWTSTRTKYFYQDSDKNFARIIRYKDNKISRELRTKSELLSVKCTQDAVYKDVLEFNSQLQLTSSAQKGESQGLLTGIKFEWQQFGDRIWMKKDSRGSQTHPGLDTKCPDGWRLPTTDEWKDVYTFFEPSIKLENKDEVISERMTTEGLWGFNLQEADYWTHMDYYIYKTFWINRNDKDDSKKEIEFPTNKNAKIEWVKKQTNEKGKQRCIFENEEFPSYAESIQYGSIKDSRNGKEYITVELAGNTWMAQNLDFVIEGGTHCRNENPNDCKKFGKMYNFKVVAQACPDGWRIPTKAEWQDMLNSLNDNHKVKVMRPFGKSGFNMLLGGDYDPEVKPKDRIYEAKFWYLDGETGGHYYFNHKGEYGKAEVASKKKDYYYVRCIKE